MAGLISVRTICSYVGRGMQGNNALLGKTLKKNPKSIRKTQPVLIFDKRQICSESSCRVF